MEITYDNRSTALHLSRLGYKQPTCVTTQLSGISVFVGKTGNSITDVKCVEEKSFVNSRYRGRTEEKLSVFSSLPRPAQSQLFSSKKSDV